MNDLSRTLVAVATPPGQGGVGCVRISGARASAIAYGLFRPLRRRRRDGEQQARFGRFIDREGQALDHGYLIEFSATAAFTGESTAELWPHGSPAVLTELVAAAVGLGAEPARPGEFTYRALRNGRLDLARAEAVRDLVEARTRFQARVAFAQAEGAVARRLAPLREELEEWIARGEAAVEFVEEQETELAANQLLEAIHRLVARCRKLLAEFETGKLVREGTTLAIRGLPNVGKSSIFNSLLGCDRAIVTSTAGTTRDTLEQRFDLSGVPVRLIDTAGIRETVDDIESEGVRRAIEAQQAADWVLWVLDGSRPLLSEESAALEQAAATGGPRKLLVINKSDLPRRLERDVAPVGFPEPVSVSALTGAGFDQLRSELQRGMLGSEVLEDPVITDARHAAAIERAAVSLDRAASARANGLTEECQLEDLREALHQLEEITGEFTTDDLYDRVFSTFCIGK